MSRYIDAEWIESRLPIFHSGLDEHSVLELLKNAPSIDIVFCEECHWARPRSLPGETGYRCVFHRIWKGENGFCDSGEREGE